MDRSSNTTILKRARQGDADAALRFDRLVYRELRALAAGFMRRERRGHSLAATELVHEAYLNLVDETGVDWHDRTHFLSIAACAMRRVLVEHARKKAAQKRGGDRRRVPLRDKLALSVKEDLDPLHLEEALSALENPDERKARVVELRFFGGLTCKEVASALGVSLRTVEKDWYVARAFLHRELSGEGLKT
jgi:RNA polymerase sigma factor (TIGR02999 family)